jgi:hypothetical protein
MHDAADLYAGVLMHGAATIAVVFMPILIRVSGR